MNAAIYNTDTGAITRLAECYADNVANQCGEGESYKVVEDTINDELYYVDTSVDGHAIRERALQDYTVSASGLTVTISGLAPGTEVHVVGAMVIADEDPTELEFDVPGVHAVRISGLAAFVEEEIEVQIDG